MKRPARAIGVKRQRQAAGPYDMGQGGHHGVPRLGGPELGVEQPLGGVVEHRDEGLPLVGAERQPGVRAAIEMQQLAEARAGLAPAPMGSPRAPFAHEARLLQRELDEAVGERHAVLPARELVEVPHVEAAIGLAIEPQDALDLESRRVPARGLPALVVEPQRPVGFKPGAPAPQAAGIQAQNVGGLQPRQRSTERPQDDLLQSSWPAPPRPRQRPSAPPWLPMAVPRTARKADISLALGSGQIMCSLRDPRCWLDK